MTPTHTLEITGQFQNLPIIADFVIDAATQAGLDDKAVYAVQMAVDEACSNIIEHAYGGQGEGTIEITCTAKPKGLQIVICDYGQAFNPDQVPVLDPTAPLAERSSRGMGLFFIHKLMDRVEFKFNTPQGNQLHLFKNK